MLLGSRSAEDWLAGDTFGDNVNELFGLDPEAASTLADLVLSGTTPPPTAPMPTSCIC